jgi:hypothetical protein
LGEQAGLTHRQLVCLLYWADGWTIRGTAGHTPWSCGTCHAELKRAQNAVKPLLRTDPYRDLLELLAEVFGWDIVHWVYDDD